MSTIREQLKHDRTQQVATEAVHWSRTHRRTIIAALGGALVLAAIILGVYTYSQKQNQAASAALGDAMHVLNSPVRQPGQPVDPNDPSYATVQERDSTALARFEGVASKFPRTDAGHYSLYMAGVVQLDAGNTAAAEKSFERARKDGSSEVSALAKVALGNIYLSTNRDAEAIKILRDVIDHPTASAPKASTEIQLAQYYEDKNQKTDALKIYQQMQKDNAKNAVGQFAQQRITELTAAAK
ncbi:MAG: hypothetical protein NVS9B15_08420 [Acidobacteriaceae bacterium]